MKAKQSLLDRVSLPVFFAGNLAAVYAITGLPIPAEAKPFLMVLVPLMLAVLLAALEDGRSGAAALLRKPFQWRIGWKWFLVTLALAFGLRLAASLLAVLLGWAESVQVRAWDPLQFAVLILILFIAAALEEVGWRGFALPEMLRRYAALPSALITGVIWGLLHVALVLPGMIYAGHSAVAMLAELVGLSFIITWLYVQTGGNVFTGVLFHAAQSFFAILNDGFSGEQQTMLVAVVYIAFSVILSIAFGMHLKRTSVQGPLPDLAVLNEREP
jgi:membrane protease YdiL (CAAX protease family)